MSLSSFLPTGLAKKKKAKASEPSPRGAKRRKSGGLPTSFGGMAPAPTRKKKQPKAKTDDPRGKKKKRQTPVIVEEEKDTHKAIVWNYGGAIATSEEQLAASLPISNISSLTGHNHLISALCFNKSGSKLASGSFDHSMRLWDFGSMTSSLQPYQVIEPEESYHVHALAFSRGRLLVAPGGAQAKLYDKEGALVLECKKGDQYLMDMKNTRGHTDLVTNVSWHPHTRSTFMTSSHDSTLRLWDVNDGTRHVQLVKATNRRGTKVGFSTFAVAPDGFMIAGGLMDGSLQLWSTKTKMSRPTTVLREAHGPGRENEIVSLKFDHQGNQLLSRAGDGTLKLWDSRLLRAPLAIWDNLPSFGPVDCLFSPNDDLIVTTTSDGHMLFFSQSTLDLVQQVKLDDKALSKCVWNQRTNQLAVGRSDGSVCILYSEELSQKGILSCLVKGAKRKAQQTDFSQLNPRIYNDAELAGEKFHDGRRPEEREEAARRAAARKDRRPDLPTVGQHGQVGTSQNHELMKKLIGIGTKRVWADPREELLKFDAESKTNPFFFGSAYADTQPKAIFSKPEDEEEQDPTNTPATK